MKRQISVVATLAMVMTLFLGCLPTATTVSAAGDVPPAPSGTMLQYTVTRTGDGTGISYLNIPVADKGYQWAEGDKLVYDVKIDGRVPGIGAVDLSFAPRGTLRDASNGSPDQNSVGAHPKNDISVYADGEWYRREIAINNAAIADAPIEALADVILASELPAGESATCYYDNIMILDKSGRMKKALMIDVADTEAFKAGCKADPLSGATYELQVVNAPVQMPARASGDTLKYTVSLDNKDTSGAFYTSIPVDTQNYTWEKGDYLQYDVRLESNSAGLGAVDMDLLPSGTLRDPSPGIPDQNGIGAHPSQDLREKALQKWYRRQIVLPSIEGYQHVLLAAELPAGFKDDAVVYYDNLLIVSAAGEVKKTLFTELDDKSGYLGQITAGNIADINMDGKVEIEELVGLQGPALDSLSIEGWELSEEFDPAYNEYQAILPFRAEKATIAASVAEGLTIEGDGEKELKVGENTFAIKVSDGSSENVYTLRITRQKQKLPDVVFHDCDTAGGVTPAAGSYVEPSTDIKTQGEASLWSEAAGWFMLYFAPGNRDIRGMDYLEFDLYTDDAGVFKNAPDCGINFSDDPEGDKNGIPAAPLKALNLKENEWNHIKLPLNSIDVNWEPASLQRLRFYALAAPDWPGEEVPLNVYIDDIRFTSDGTDPDWPAVGTNGSRLVKTHYPTNEAVVAITDVLYYGAKGDGVTDDSAAFQKALNYAASQGGGVVYVPEGQYVIRSSLTIPSGVILRGDLAMPDGGATKGTVLLAYPDKGNENGLSFIRMDQGAGLKYVAIYYPEQDASNVTPYPWTIEEIGQHGIAVENVILVNAYNGIKLGPSANALQNLRNLYGTPLNTGIFIDHNVDICRYENINFAPKYWLESGLGTPDAAVLKAYLRSHATALTIEQVDWSYLTDITVDGYQVGVLLRKSTGRSDGSSANGQVYNLKITDCATGIMADCINEIGFLFTKADVAADLPFHASSSFTSSITFKNVAFKGAGEYGVLNEGSGLLSLQDCTVELTGDGAKYGVASQGQGSQLLCVSTSFSGKGQHILADTKVSSAKIVNCMTESTLKVDNKAGKAVSVAYDENEKTTLLPEGYDYNRVVVTKPAGENFVDVSQAPYNVVIGTIKQYPTEDASAALQKAIDDMAKAGGGIVYVPSGTILLQKPIVVKSGVELRGSSDMAHHTMTPATTFITNYGAGDPDGTALITVEGKAGLYGFRVFYNELAIADVTPYAFTIRGNGSDLYIRNVTLSNSYQGVDLATNRCDNHYVESLCGAPLKTGIVAGAGSKNGLIRDAQFNLHYFSSNPYPGPDRDGNDIWDHMVRNTCGVVIRETENQICYNNFIFGAHKGMLVEDGADVYTLGHGTDGSTIGLSIEGNGSKALNFVNSQLVCLHGKDDNILYINVGGDFDGVANIICTNMWGEPENAVKIDSGRVNMMGGNILRSAGMTFWMNGGDLVVSGMHSKQANLDSDYYMDNGSHVIAFGNMYASGLKIDGPDKANVSGTDFGTKAIPMDPSDPGENPGGDPGKDPGKDPGEDPGKDPGKDPEGNPGTGKVFPILAALLSALAGGSLLAAGFRRKKSCVGRG